MFKSKLPKVLSYQIWCTLKRLHLINKNILTNKNNFYCLYNITFSNVSYNTVQNNREKEKFVTNENDFCENLNTKIYKKNKRYKFQNVEIDLANRVLGINRADQTSFIIPPSIKENFLISDLKNIVNKDWNQMTTVKIIEILEMVSWYAYKNPNVVDKRQYQTILNVLIKRCKVLTDHNINRILYSLELWSKSTNDLGYTFFLKKFEQLFNTTSSIQQSLLIMTSLYRLHFLDHSTFSYNNLLKINADSLDYKCFFQYVFLLRANKWKIPVSLIDLERTFEKYFVLMNIEELAIMASLFYKYEYEFANKNLVLMLLKRLETNLTKIDPICIGAIIKSLKLTVDLRLIPEYISLLKAIEVNMSQINTFCLTHILHLQERILLKNDYIISETLNRYYNNLENLRIKDIERILLTLFQFNYDSKTTSFYSQAVDELLKPDRTKERQTYPNSFLSCVQYLFQSNYYSEEALEIIMDPYFRKLMPQKNTWLSYIIIQNCLELDHPETTGPRLDESALNVLYSIAEMSKRTVNDSPGKRQKFIADVIYNFQCTYGNKTNIYTDFLLPHTFLNDIIICYDKKKKLFPPRNEESLNDFKKKIKYAPNDGNTWYVLIVGSSNHILKRSKHPTGFLKMHMRHLECAGYKPILINYPAWIENKCDIFKKIFCI